MSKRLRERSPLARAAIEYAERGFHVFPCRPRDKRPLITGGSGFREATCDRVMVREWWAKHPEANIGLVPGLSNLVVWDLDGPTGIQSGESLGVTPSNTRQVATGKGQHLYFMRPTGAAIGNLKPAPGIDIRADAGYVIAPPSIHPTGRPYAWVDATAPFLDLPEHLAAVLLGDAARNRPILKGDRNNRLTSYLGGLRRRGAEFDELFDKALEFNATHCDPPLDDSEVRRVAQSIARYPSDLEDEESVFAELDAKYAVVQTGSKVPILQESHDTIELLPREEFRALLANRFVSNGKHRQTVADFWFRHPRRREYDRLVFEPGHTSSERSFNLWRGWPVSAVRGDCGRFLDHLRQVVASGNDELFQWVLCWFAQLIQDPMNKPGTALVLRGKQGTGKTIVGQVMGKLLGRHYQVVGDQRGLLGQFNFHLTQCLLLQAEEAFWAGSKSAEGALKHLITGSTLMIEKKHVDIIPVANHMRLLVTSNEQWVVPAGLEERRFCVIDVSDSRIQDRVYFEALFKQMDNGGYEALMYELLHLPIKADLRSVPSTSALIEQQLASLEPVESWWFEILDSGRLPGDMIGRGCSPSHTLYMSYVSHAQTRGAPRRSIETIVGTYLRKIARARRCSVVNNQGKAIPCYQLPSLEQCRQRFTEGSRFGWKWTDPTEWQPDEQGEADNQEFDESF